MSATRTVRPLATENAGIETTTDDPPGRPRLVATDFFSLYRPSECDLRVWLRAQDVEEAAPGPYSQVLMKLGTEHERRHLDPLSRTTSTSAACRSTSAPSAPASWSPRTSG